MRTLPASFILTMAGIGFMVANVDGAVILGTGASAIIFILSAITK